LAELPLHAAGVYVGAHQDNAANYIVSSYTPTLSALIHARAERADPVSEDVLLVSLPAAQSMPWLPNAAAEANIVESAISPGSITVMSDLHTTVQAVLERLPDIAVLHLACHGHQSQENPLDSGSSMYDGRLRLEQLMGLQLPKAQLAYLSACETAGTDENQPDEAINLAATMLFAGFRSVVATMWSASQSRLVSTRLMIYAQVYERF
jgi:CHAT domain-containing protein